MKIIPIKIPVMIYAIIIIAYFQLSSIEVKSQDIHFSQFYNSPLTINPSLTGAFNGDVRVLTSYKDQWRSISTPYKTFMFACDMKPLMKQGSTGFLGLGISFISDQAGKSQLGLNQVNVSLAYHVPLSAYNTLSGGIQGGFAQRNVGDIEKLKWDNKYNGTSYDPDLPSKEPPPDNVSYGDYAGGVQWNYSKGAKYATAHNQLNMSLGVALFHVNQPNQSFYSSAKEKLPMKLVVHGFSMIGTKNKTMSLVPSFIYMQQGKFVNTLIGGSLRFKLIPETRSVKGVALSLGGHFRLEDAFIPSIQIEVANFGLGLSYDVNTSNLTNVTSSRGGLELSLRYVNPNPFTGKPAIKSPRLF